MYKSLSGANYGKAEIYVENFPQFFIRPVLNTISCVFFGPQPISHFH
jgi:hypothetical protein